MAGTLDGGGVGRTVEVVVFSVFVFGLDEEHERD